MFMYGSQQFIIIYVNIKSLSFELLFWIIPK
jgi:hypothetical protein